VETSCKKDNGPSSWRQRNQAGLQMAALVLGAVALFTLIFCMQNAQTTLLGVCFAILCVGFNVIAWAG